MASTVSCYHWWLLFISEWYWRRTTWWRLYIFFSLDLTSSAWMFAYKMLRAYEIWRFISQRTANVNGTIGVRIGACVLRLMVGNGVCRMSTGRYFDDRCSDSRYSDKRICGWASQSHRHPPLQVLSCAVYHWGQHNADWLHMHGDHLLFSRFWAV